MRNLLLSLARTVVVVLGLLPEIVTAVVGLLLMAVFAVEQLVDARAMDEGRVTFLFQLGTMAQRAGLNPWIGVYMYFAPLILGVLFFVIAARMGHRPRVVRTRR